MANYIDHINKNATRFEMASKPIADSIAEEFSTSRTYAVGDYVMREYKLYKCISAVTTAGSWVANKWQECKITGEFQEIVNEVEDNIMLQIPAVDNTLTTQGAAADAKKVGDEINDLKGDLKDAQTETEERIFAEIEPSPSHQLGEILPTFIVGNATVFNSTDYASVEVDYSLTQYITYYRFFDSNCSIWFDDVSALSYIAIVKMQNASALSDETTQSGRKIAYSRGYNASRYRKSEDNLPTLNNKLAVYSGMLIMVTIPTSVDVETVYINIEYEGQDQEDGELDYSLLNNNIKLNTSQILQVKKPNYVEYINASGDDSSTERLNVFLGTFNGYILFQFVHTVLPNINSNIWRISKAQVTDNKFNVLFNATTTGEWECAIKLNGRSDFAGGVLHGDEVMTDISFFLDGKLVSLSALTSKTPFVTLSIVQESNLYDPNDSTTVFANHSSLHLFENKLTIKQSLKFIVDCEMGTSYLAMFPIAKTCSTKYYTDQLYKYQDIVIPISQIDAKEVTLLGNNITSTFTLKKHTDVDNRTGNLSIQDNGGGAYNKCYYISCGTGTTVAEGTIWKSETEYVISR